MQKYTCPICHRLSYTAAGPDTANSDKCLNPNCPGHVVPVEPVKKQAVIIKMVRKEVYLGHAKR